MRVTRALCLCLLAVCGWSIPVRGQEGYFPGAEGVRLFYRIMGSGPDTVVVIHGGPGTGMREGLDLEEGLSRARSCGDSL